MLEAKAPKERGVLCVDHPLQIKLLLPRNTRLAKVGGDVGHCVSSGPDAPGAAATTQPCRLNMWPAWQSHGPCSKVTMWGPQFWPGYNQQLQPGTCQEYECQI